MLQMLDILPFHIQHKRNAILLLNRILKNDNPKRLVDYIKRHIKSPIGWDPEKESEHLKYVIDGNGPEITLFAPETANANQSLLKKAFPITAREWFNDLPCEIRLLLGTKKFEKAYLEYVCDFCRHPVYKSYKKCSFCNSKVNLEDMNLNEIIDNIKFAYSSQSITTIYEESAAFNNFNCFLNTCALKVFNDKIIEIDGGIWCQEFENLDIRCEEDLLGCESDGVTEDSFDI